MPEPVTIDIRTVLKAWAGKFETTLTAFLADAPDVPPTLAEAVRYAVQNGGKRVRPFIVTRACELCGAAAEIAAPAAVAIECVHAFSLVHDDLPGMDNDDLRRGRPTCHKAFGEAVAILAGDALVTLSFEILSTRIPDPAVAASAIAELARGTGWAGMIAGQTLDILNENAPPDLKLVERIHRCKTARLLECSARLGAISAKADAAKLEAFATYGRELGLAFQIADDLLDVLGDAAKLGKAVAKDSEKGKQTYPACVGIEASQRAARECADRAIAALKPFGPAADDLRALAKFVVERDR